jgi:tetratricopeptide (TPR) repeat protein
VPAKRNLTPAELEIVDKRRPAMAMFRLGMKADSTGVHRTLNRAPKGKGWVPCVNMPEGMMCRPAKVREAIEHYRKAYEIFPDIVVLNQLGLAHEMLGEAAAARECYGRMREQAIRENIPAYVQGADLALGRLGGAA